MATQSVSIPEDTWTQVTTASAFFQVISSQSVFVVESASVPTSTSVIKIALPKRIYSFDRTDGNLYAYSPERSNTIAFDPKS